MHRARFEPKLTPRAVYSNSSSNNSSSNRNPSPLSNTTSPLLSALQNPTELISRSIPFPAFLSGSSSPPPSSAAPHSLGSASGGVGLSGGPSPPPSAPASYSSATRPIRGYPGLEELAAGPYASSPSPYYHTPLQSHTLPIHSHSHNPNHNHHHHHHNTHNHNHNRSHSHGNNSNSSHNHSLNNPNNIQRYPHAGSPNAQLNAAGTYLRPGPGESRFACELGTVDEAGLSGPNARFASARGAGAAGGGENIVCLGYDGGVEIWRAGRNAVERIGALDGLKGAVKTAKVFFLLSPF